MPGVIRLRRCFGGRVAPGDRRVPEIAKRTFQHTSGAKPFRHIGKDLGAAFPANSNYPDHCWSRLDVPRLYSVKFCHTLRRHEAHQLRLIETRISLIYTNRYKGWLKLHEICANSCNSCLSSSFVSIK